MVICSPQLGLAPDSVLGGEVFDRQILLGLAKRGIRVEIILPKDKQHDKNIKNWYITYLPLPHFPAIFGNLLIIPYLFIVYKNTEFSILRIHQPQFLGLGSIFFKIINPKVKTVATYHQFKESNFPIVSKLINNFWDEIVTDSNFVKNKLVKTYQIDPSKITVVHNGVPSYLKPAMKDNRLEKKLKIEGKIILLFMGFFNDRKNPLFLLDVMSRLQNRKSIVLIFWGGGPLRAQILKRAKELEISENIRILKPLFGEEKNKMHNLADIFVHPSKDEGFALAPLESMSCAKPVIMTKSFSAQEAVTDGFNGFLCKENDLSDWRKKLTFLTQNEKKRIRMGKASLEKVKKEFQWEISVQKHIDVFKHLTK